MSTKELIQEYNELAAKTDRAPLTGWKQSKEALAEKVEELRKVADPLAVETASEPLGDVEPDTVPETVAEATEAEPVKPVEPRRTIGALVGKLLLDADLQYAQIVEVVKAEFSNAQTSPRSIASVATHLRKAGVDVPKRSSGKSKT